MTSYLEKEDVIQKFEKDNTRGLMISREYTGSFAAFVTETFGQVKMTDEAAPHSS